MDGNLNKKHTFGFTTIDGRRLTTSDFDALKQMAAQGRITPETLIEADDKVYVAAKVKGLVFGTPPASSPGQVSGGAPFSLDPPPASSPGQVSGGAPFSLDPPPASSPEPQTIVVKHKKKEKGEGCFGWLCGLFLFLFFIPCVGGAMCGEIFGIDQDTATGALFILGLLICVIGPIAAKYED